MKKVLLLIGASLASFSLSFAQAPLEMLQKSDNNAAFLREGVQLPAGFTYANRDSVAANKVSGVGTGKPGVHLAAVIELPAQAGQVIKGIVYAATTEDTYGKIFVASRPASGQMGAYTFVQVKDIETQNTALTTGEFESPVTTEEGKVYVVGYEVKSTGEESTPTTFPLLFAADSQFFPEGNLLTLQKDGSSSVGAVGDPIQMADLSEQKFGNLVIVVQGDNLASTFDIAAELTPAVYSQDGRILISGANNGFVAYDMTGRVVATDSNSVLPAGTYIVKAYNGSVESVAKVVVK